MALYDYTHHVTNLQLAVMPLPKVCLVGERRPEHKIGWQLQKFAARSSFSHF